MIHIASEKRVAAGAENSVVNESAALPTDARRQEHQRRGWFSVPEAGTPRRVEDYVAGWLRGLVVTGHVDPLDDLTVLPHVVAREQASLDVVFDGRSGSRRWKDWMVFLTRDLRTLFPDLRFECFYDLVSDTAHLASLEQDSPDA